MYFHKEFCWFIFHSSWLHCCWGNQNENPNVWRMFLSFPSYILYNSLSQVLYERVTIKFNVRNVHTSHYNSLYNFLAEMSHHFIRKTFGKMFFIQMWAGLSIGSFTSVEQWNRFVLLSGQSLLLLFDPGLFIEVELFLLYFTRHVLVWISFVFSMMAIIKGSK